MRIYLDQMFRSELAQLLRAEGHDVARTAETGQARSDNADILSHAVAEGRILVTLDEHFGDWAILPLRRHAGVIRLKIHPPYTEPIATRLVPLQQTHSQTDFANRLVIVSHSRERWIVTSE